MKSLDKNGAAFQRLCILFLTLSSAKIKEVNVVKAQIRAVLKDKVFEQLLTLN